MGVKRRAAMAFSTILAVGLLVSSFQACGPALQYSSKTKAAGGEGFDEKLYQSYGDCAGSVDVKESILISSDFSKASLKRENCLELPSPQPIDISELKFADDERTVLARKNLAFDLKVASTAQKITRHFCESSGSSPSVQALVWEVVGDTTALYGNVTEATGADSGILQVQNPSSAQPLRYVSSVGQTSSMDLSLSNASSGALNYSLGNSSAVSAPQMLCASQEKPEISVISTASAQATVVTTNRYTMPTQASSAGTLLVVGLVYPQNIVCTTSITDNAGNSYVMAPAHASFAQGNSEVWYVQNSRPGATQLTFETCGGRPGVFYLEVSGIDRDQPLDGTPRVVSHGTASTSLNAPAISPVGPAFIFSVGHAEFGVTGLSAGSLFTALNAVAGDSAAYLITESVGSFGARWDQTSGRYCASTVAFKGR